MQKGKLYLVPVTIGGKINSSIPGSNLEVLSAIDHYIVENIQSAVSFIKHTGIQKKLHDIHFYVFSKKISESDISVYLQPAENGKDIALMSESGTPCIADPGEEIVMTAHRMGIRVIPLVGPSSIILSLMASGLNAENFSFNGYLPISRNNRIRKLKEIEKKIYSDDQTQLFIEAPQRNDKLIDDILGVCKPETMLCIAKNITMPDEHIETRTIQSWRRTRIIWGKNPIIFVLGK
jgi:16S rRNA (cytidine1402-2'-O)-methyltransferase